MGASGQTWRNHSYNMVSVLVSSGAMADILSQAVESSATNVLLTRWTGEHTHHTPKHTQQARTPRVRVASYSRCPVYLLYHSFSFLSKMNEDREDRKVTLRFNYEGFSTGEQNKVEDTNSSVKQRKHYNCVSRLSAFTSQSS
jgi:hypothetical protein